MKIKDLKLSEPKITKLKSGWQLVHHEEFHKDLDFLKKIVFIWPTLLKNQRVKFVIENNYTPPSNEFFLWFTERYHNRILHDVINITLRDIFKPIERGVPSDIALTPPEGWELHKLEDVDINSHMEGNNKDHYLSSTHPSLINKKLFRPEEDFANEEDYLKKKTGESVRNWWDWDQHVNPTSYGKFYCWIKDTLLYYYVVPLYWEKATKLEKNHKLKNK